MIIKKIFNNNALVAIDSANKEYVVMGSGIGFKKSSGGKVDERLVEKIFILKQKDVSEKIKILLEDIPSDYVSVCYDIVEYSKDKLDTQLSEYLFVSLTDHLYNAIKLFDEGVVINNSIIWEIKKFYKKEFEIGLQALNFIESKLGKRLPEEEAGNIALHLINAQVNSSSAKLEDVANQTQKIQDILSIIKYAYNINLDENSISYERFITHLRFFFQRLKNRQNQESTEDDFLLLQIKEKYTKAYECMLKIERYLEVELKNEEKLYLTIHIQRITEQFNQ